MIKYPIKYILQNVTGGAGASTTSVNIYLVADDNEGWFIAYPDQILAYNRFMA